VSNYISPKLFQSGLVKTRLICELEERYNNIINTRFFNKSYQSAKAMPSFIVYSSDSSSDYASLALLYKDMKHFT